MSDFEDVELLMVAMSIDMWRNYLIHIKAHQFFWLFFEVPRGAQSMSTLHKVQ